MTDNPVAASPFPVDVSLGEAEFLLDRTTRQIRRLVEAGKLSATGHRPVRISLSSLFKYQPTAAEKYRAPTLPTPQKPTPQNSNFDTSPQGVLPGMDEEPEIRAALLALAPSQVGPVAARFRAIRQVMNHDGSALAGGKSDLGKMLSAQLKLSYRHFQRLHSEYERVRKDSGEAAAIQTLCLNSPDPQKWTGSPLDPGTDEGRSNRCFLQDCWEIQHLTRKQSYDRLISYLSTKQRGTGPGWVYGIPDCKAVYRFINLAPPHGLGGDQNPRRNGPEAIKEAAGYIDCHYNDEYAGDTWCIDEWELDGAFYNAQKRREIYWSIYLVSVIDERSTFALDWILAYHLNAETVLDLLERCVRTYGPPLELRSDRGGHFRGKVAGRTVVQSAGKLIDKLTGAMGHLGVKPCGPETSHNPRSNRIERMHGIYAEHAQRALEQGGFGPSWRGSQKKIIRPGVTERDMSGIDERVKRHIEEHCKAGTCGPLILSTADAERIVAKWVEEINLADTDARGCEGMSRFAAFQHFGPPREEVERRRQLATPELIDLAFAERDDRVIRAGGVIEWRDGLRYSCPELVEYAGEVVPMLRYRRDTSRLLVEITGQTVVAERRIPVGRNDAERCSEENRKLNHTRKLLARARDFGELNELSEVPLAAGSAATEHREISSVEWMAKHRREIVEPREEGVGFADLE